MFLWPQHHDGRAEGRRFPENKSASTMEAHVVMEF
jgi:hypothetical protein